MVKGNRKEKDFYQLITEEVKQRKDTRSETKRHDEMQKRRQEEQAKTKEQKIADLDKLIDLLESKKPVVWWLFYNYSHDLLNNK